MDPVEANKKSELMREVDLLEVVQEKIVTKLSGFRSELATQESGVTIMPETFGLRRLILPWTEDSFSEEQQEEDKKEEHKEEENKKEKDKEKENEDKKAAGWGRQTILPSISWIRDLDQNSPRVLETKKIIST